jgi:Subunit ChlI of Mg-chelatase
MVAHVATVAFLGLEARAVEVQVQISSGLPKFLVVGLPDKAVGESRERVHAALAAIALSLPPKRITVNLSPADLPKEGSHYDLPIALGLLAAMGAVDAEMLAAYVVVGSGTGSFADFKPNNIKKHNSVIPMDRWAVFNSLSFPMGDASHKFVVGFYRFSTIFSDKLVTDYFCYEIGDPELPLEAEEAGKPKIVPVVYRTDLDWPPDQD